MAAGFDAAEGGQPVPEQQHLVGVLRHHLWPILSLPTSLHDLLNAWAYLRQFALTGNRELAVHVRKGSPLMVSAFLQPCHSFQTPLFLPKI